MRCPCERAPASEKPWPEPIAHDYSSSLTSLRSIFSAQPDPLLPHSRQRSRRLMSEPDVARRKVLQWPARCRTPSAKCPFKTSFSLTGHCLVSRNKASCLCPSPQPGCVLDGGGVVCHLDTNASMSSMLMPAERARAAALWGSPCSPWVSRVTMTLPG